MRVTWPIEIEKKLNCIVRNISTFFQERGEMPGCNFQDLSEGMAEYMVLQYPLVSRIFAMTFSKLEKYYGICQPTFRKWLRLYKSWEREMIQ